MPLPSLSGTGRLTEDPSLKFTASGKAVCTVRLAFSDRKKNEQTGQWEDGDKVFLDASVWGDEAEHVAESLARGHEVLVSGKFRQREFTTREGEKRVVYELAFATVAPTLKYATAKVSKMQRSGAQQSQAAQGADDPWSTGGPNAGPGRAQSEEAPF